MKNFLYLILGTLLLTSSARNATAQAELSVDIFYDSLEPHGDWLEVADYGYAWRPRDVGPDWRPYNDGRWVYTDAGWTWASEEPFGWAVYHYGRWALLEDSGWVWVPGTEWGPAWVSWRTSSDYVGWAPLPPEARFSHSRGLSARVDVDYDIGPGYYSFVEIRNLGAPRLRSVILEPRRNITVIRETTNITQITYVNNVVYNRGPEYDRMSRESSQPIERFKLDRRREDRGEGPERWRNKFEGDTFRVAELPFEKKASSAPKKVAAKVEKVEVDRGWKNAGSEEEIAQVRSKMKEEKPAPADPSAKVDPAGNPETPDAQKAPADMKEPEQPRRSEEIGAGTSEVPPKDPAAKEGMDNLPKTSDTEALTPEASPRAMNPPGEERDRPQKDAKEMEAENAAKQRSAEQKAATENALERKASERKVPDQEAPERKAAERNASEPQADGDKKRGGGEVPDDRKDKRNRTTEQEAAPSKEPQRKPDPEVNTQRQTKPERAEQNRQPAEESNEPRKQKSKKADPESTRRTPPPRREAPEVALPAEPKVERVKPPQEAQQRPPESAPLPNPTPEEDKKEKADKKKSKED